MLFRKTLNTNLKYYFNVFPPLETALEFLECTFNENYCTNAQTISNIYNVNNETFTFAIKY